MAVDVPAMMADVEEIQVVVAHSDRATLRVGDVFLKIDADQTRTDVEVEAMSMAPVPTPGKLKKGRRSWEAVGGAAARVRGPQRAESLPREVRRGTAEERVLDMASEAGCLYRSRCADLKRNE